MQKGFTILYILMFFSSNEYAMQEKESAAEESIYYMCGRPQDYRCKYSSFDRNDVVRHQLRCHRNRDETTIAQSNAADFPYICTLTTYNDMPCNRVFKTAAQYKQHRGTHASKPRLTGVKKLGMGGIKKPRSLQQWTFEEVKIPAAIVAVHKVLPHADTISIPLTQEEEEI